MDLIFELILRDKATKERWKTPRHSDNKHEDDYHDEGGIKNDILDDLDKKLKAKYGSNPDIIIENGKIVIKSTQEETKGVIKRTDLNADDYFERVIGFTVMYFASREDIDLMGITIKDSESTHLLIIVARMN